MTGRLIWLPFDPALVGELPASLRYQQIDPERPPATAGEVTFYVLPYRFRAADGAVIGRLPRLEVVQTLTAGIEHIQADVPPGVTLCNGRGIHDASTAELAVALTLASLRGIPQMVRDQDRAVWRPDRGESLADKTVLIVGYGQIGEAVEERMRPFEVARFLRVARTRRDGVLPIEELPQLLPQADVVVVMVPGTAATRGLFDAAMLARLRSGALLVNLSRGPVVRTDALLAELETGRIAAAIDVVDPEPLPAEHPLWRAPNLLISPHVGGNSSAMDSRGYGLLREQLARYAAREPLLNVITGDY